MSDKFKLIVFACGVYFVAFRLWMVADLAVTEYNANLEFYNCTLTYEKIKEVSQIGWLSPCRKYFDEVYFYELEGWGYDPTGSVVCKSLSATWSRPLRCHSTVGVGGSSVDMSLGVDGVRRE